METARARRRSPDPDVKSARRVVDLLELLGTARRPLRLRDVTERLGIPASSASMLLKTLSATRMVTRDDSGAYRLGVKMLSLAHAALQTFDVRAVARPTMAETAIRVRSTCNLAVLDGGSVVYVEKVQDPNSPIQLVTHIGARLPAHATALGKVLLAEMEPQTRDQLLARHQFTTMTASTCRSVAELAEHLAAYDERGYAVDDEESHPGVMCFAAPVRDYTETVVAALSLSGIKGARLGFDHPTDRAGREVKRAAARISAALGSASAVSG
jgi:DNA-binding IclR family transcriptional regulator